MQWGCVSPNVYICQAKAGYDAENIFNSMQKSCGIDIDSQLQRYAW